VTSPRRNHAVFALVSDDELAGLLDACRRMQRTSQHLAGQIIQEWLEQRGYMPDHSRVDGVSKVKEAC
jgi:hypothetical protein